MEPRTITVIDTRVNGVTTFSSTAETMAEMLDDFRANNIDATGMAIQEGLTRTELDATSLLPKDVPYRGTVTNNLVFRLTQKEKRIKSGISEQRHQVYSAIKQLSLEDAIKETFGRNFTQVATEDLMHFVNNASSEPKEEGPITNCPIYKAFMKLLDVLKDDGFIDECEFDGIVSSFDEKKRNTNNRGNAIYSADALDKMFEGL